MRFGKGEQRAEPLKNSAAAYCFPGGGNNPLLAAKSGIFVQDAIREREGGGLLGTFDPLCVGNEFFDLQKGIVHFVSLIARCRAWNFSMTCSVFCE
jgi:hypothetical protein